MSTQTQQQAILLRGVIPNPWAPSISLFNLELDVTDIFTEDGSDYMAWKQGLQDMLNELDIQYAAKVAALRGRRVEAEYKTVVNGKGKRQIRITIFKPYPSRFMSQLGYVRTKFYGSVNTKGILEEFSMIIAEEKRGGLTIQTRLVPETLLPKLRLAMKELDSDIDNIQADITRYEQTQDFQKIKDYILTNIPDERWSKRPQTLHTQLHYIQLNPWPIVASRDFIETFTDEETKKEIRESLGKVVEQVVQTAQKTLSGIIGNLALYLKKEVSVRQLPIIQRDLDNLKKWSKEANTYHFIQSDITAIENIVKAIQSEDAEDIKLAAQITADYFDTATSENPVDTLQAVENKLLGDIDPRIKSLVSEALGG